MSENITAGLVWSGRGEDVESITLAVSEDAAQNMFNDSVSSGLADKNAGEFVGVVFPEMDAATFDKLSGDEERLKDIINGQDDEFSVSVLEAYEVEHGDWDEEAFSGTYPDGSVGDDVQIR